MTARGAGRTLDSRGGWRSGTLLVFLLGASCFDSCRCGSVELARLSARNGEVEQSRATPAGLWADAPVGARFITGDAVRTLAGAGAELRLAGGGNMRLGSRTTVRFLAERPGQDRVHVEAGQAELEAGPEALDVETARGATHLLSGGRLRVSYDESGNVRLDVMVGTAVIEEEAEGDRPRLAAGQSALLGPGGRVLKRWQEGANEPAGQPPDAGVMPAPPVGRIPPGTPTADLSAKESVSIHDHYAPTLVRIRFADLCPGQAEVVVRDKDGSVITSARGVLEVVVSVPAGTYRYDVVCAGQTSAAASGTVTVVASAAAPAEPAALVSLAADGSQESIRYRGEAPPVTFRWPDPPAVDAFALVIQRPGKPPERRAVDRAQSTVGLGQLADGQYEWWFEAAESDRASPHSRLELAADGAAPSAELSAREQKGGKVRVVGRAAPGAEVFVAKERVKLDGQRRFSIDTRSSTAAMSIPVRVEHAPFGTQVFMVPIDRAAKGRGK